MNQHENTPLLMYHTYTICPRSSDPFYIVAYYIKWVTTSWTYGICVIHPKRRIFTVYQTVRFFTLKNVFDQKHKNRVDPCLNSEHTWYSVSDGSPTLLLAGSRTVEMLLGALLTTRCIFGIKFKTVLKNPYTYCKFFCRSLK